MLTDSAVLADADPDGCQLVCARSYLSSGTLTADCLPAR